MTDIRLEHALISTQDLDRSLAFYAALFPDWGVRWDGRQEGAGRWVHFGPVGSQPSYLSINEDPSAKPPQAESYATLAIQHIGFAHPDVRALEARLRAQGISPTERMDDGKYRRAYFVDPDGHELEFVERLG